MTKIQKSFLALGAALVAVVPLSAQGASTLGFRLKLRVPVVCYISQAYSPDSASGEIVIETNCNAQAYAVTLGGDLGSLPLDSASATQGRITPFGGQVQVSPDYPGRNTIRLQMDGDLSDLQSASVQIQAL